MADLLSAFICVHLRFLVVPAASWLAARIELPEAIGALFLVVALVADVGVVGLGNGPVETFIVRAGLGLLGVTALYHAIERLYVQPAPSAETLARRRVVRACAGLGATFAIYHALPAVIDYVQPQLADAWLNALEIGMVGSLTDDRPLWEIVAAIRTPALTAWFSFAYSLQFPGYFATGIILAWQRRYAAARRVYHILSLAMWVGFFGYLAFPALGPGVYFGGPARATRQQDVVAWLVAEYGVARGTFPSLHAAVSLIALLAARRYLPRLFWLYLPLVLSLWVSTIYLRHHYLPDLLAGWLLAIGATVALPALEGRWEHLRRLSRLATAPPGRGFGGVPQ